jgi:cell division protein FtsA
MSSNNKTICTLDIGSNKVCCCVVSADVSKVNPKIKVLSYYPISSNAFKNGAINNIENLSHDIGSAIQSAEEMAGVKIDGVIVSFPSLMCESGYTKISANLEGDMITEAYVSKLISKSFHRIVNEKEEVIHFLPVNYSINRQDGIKKPIGQYADSLGIDIHYVKTNRSFKKNLESVIAKNRMKVSSFCNSAYASGLACLTEDEKEIGATVIDIGESSCDIAMFKGSCLMYSFSLSGGGLKITTDIKSQLKCSLATAERLKILKGALASYDNHGSIEYKEDGGVMNTMPSQVSNYDFIKIIKTTMGAILDGCNDSLKDNPFYQVSDSVIVITGGVSSTNGIKDMAENIFDRPVRIGVSQDCTGMPSSYDNPTSVSSVGLVRYGLSTMTDKDMLSNKDKSKKMKKIVEWFKESL